jgi:hypothetical protein
MDLQPIIRSLKLRRTTIDETIECLERLRTVSARTEAPVAAKRRGRKNMTLEDRQKVSLRMKEYWEARRSQKTRTAASGT